MIDIMMYFWWSIFFLSERIPGRSFKNIVFLFKTMKEGRWEKQGKCFMDREKIPLCKSTYHLEKSAIENSSSRQYAMNRADISDFDS